MAGKWSQKVQLGQEASAGTPATTFDVWRGVGGHIEDARTTEQPQEMIGYTSSNSTRNYTPMLMGTIDFAATPATFEQLPHLFEMGIEASGGPVNDAPGTGEVYTYTTTPNDTAQTIQTYTIRSGDAVDVQQMVYSFAEQVVLSWTATEALQMSATINGRGPTDSSFATTTEFDVDTILGGKLSFYIDDLGTFPATTQITGTLLSATITINTGRKAKFISDDGSLDFNFVYLDPDELNVEIEFTYESTSDAWTERDKWRSNTPRSVSFEFTGPALGTPGTTYSDKKFIASFTGVYTQFDAMSDDDGNSIVTATLSSGIDLTNDDHIELIVVNELTALIS